MNFQKNKEVLNKDYWEKKYKIDDIGWDIGAISPPLKNYIDGIKDKSIRILIPGAGNSYEATYLYESGFKDVTVVDIAEQPLKNISTRCSDFPKEKLLNADFFTLTGNYDLILEQTFFCALHPTLRMKYAEQIHNLLSKKGTIFGLLFSFPLTEIGPPYGGSHEEYRDLFKSLFHIRLLEPCYNSIKPRANNELFFIFEKK